MTPAAHRQRTAAALTAVAVLLGITVLVTAQLTPGYDHRYDTISRLASPGQPFAIVVRAAIVAAGVQVTLTAVALQRSAPTSQRLPGLLVGVAGAAAVVAGVAPKDPPDVDPTMVSQLHVAASLIGVGALAAAMAYVTRSSPHRVERRRSAAALTIIVIAATAFPFTWGTVIYGILQRVILLTALAWLTATARHNPTGDLNADLPTPNSFNRLAPSDESTTSTQPTISTTHRGPLSPTQRALETGTAATRPHRPHRPQASALQPDEL